MALSCCLFPGSQNQLCLLLLHGITLTVADMLAGFNISFVIWCKRHDKDITPSLSKVQHCIGRISEAPDKPVQMQGPGFLQHFSFGINFYLIHGVQIVKIKCICHPLAQNCGCQILQPKCSCFPLHNLLKIHMCQQHCYL